MLIQILKWIRANQHKIIDSGKCIDSSGNQKDMNKVTELALSHPKINELKSQEPDQIDIDGTHHLLVSLTNQI